jgi:Fic family protein
MSGKPFQSQLEPYEAEIQELLTKAVSYREIAERLNTKHGLTVTHNAIYSFVTASSRRHKFVRRFYDGLDDDLKNSLLRQITALWTHGSNAIEGNTLTLGETVQVIELGLTIGGKPLKDHQEAYGHARAVEIIRRMADEGPLTEDQLFDLHRAIMPESPVDSLNPIGAWKRDYNGTTGVLNGQTKYMEYSKPDDVPFLMAAWLKEFNRLLDLSRSKDDAVDAYTWAHMSFVRIHPFFDGNGRMARLLANLPVLRCGFPPILVSPEQRGRYINILWAYQLTIGQLSRGDNLLPEHSSIQDFKVLIAGEWNGVMRLVKEARAAQKRR